MRADREPAFGSAPRFGAPPRLGAALMSWIAFVMLVAVIALATAAMLAARERGAQAFEVAAQAAAPAVLVVRAVADTVLSHEPVEPVEPVQAVDPSGPVHGARRADVAGTVNRPGPVDSIAFD